MRRIKRVTEQRPVENACSFAEWVQSRHEALGQIVCLFHFHFGDMRQCKPSLFLHFTPIPELSYVAISRLAMELSLLSSPPGSLSLDNAINRLAPLANPASLFR
jgi:hypothetical protein